MKSIKSVAIAAAMLLVTVSCAKKEAEEVKAEDPQKAVGEMVIRYVDVDSLLANYNLAKDVNEHILRLNGQFDQAQQQRASEIQKFAGEVERKYKSNGYLTEESFNVDQQKLNKMQNDAQNYLGNLQATYQKEMDGLQKQLNDSVESYISIYAKENGIDMVVRKSAALGATLYANEKFDVTKSVISGLNKRYTKVEKAESK